MAVLTSHTHSLLFWSKLYSPKEVLVRLSSSITCRVRYVYPERACLFHKVQKKLGKKGPWSSFTFLVLPSVLSSQTPTEMRLKERSSKNAGGSVCTRLQARHHAFKYVRMRGKHVMLSNDLCPPCFSPKNEPVRMHTTICGRGQRAFQNRYIFRPDDAREETKVRRYSVLSSLTVERSLVKPHPDHASLPHPFSNGRLALVAIYNTLGKEGRG